MYGHTHHFPRFLHPSWKCEQKYSHRLSSKSSQYGCSPVSQAQWVCIDWAGHCWLERKDFLWWPRWVQLSHLQCGAVMHPIRFDYHQKYLSMHPHFVQIHDNSELLINKISAKEMANDLALLMSWPWTFNINFNLWSLWLKSVSCAWCTIKRDKI